MIELNLPAWLPARAIQFFLAGLAGLLCHYLSKRGKGEIPGVSLYQYLFIDTPGLTFATLLALVAATFAAVAIGGLEEMKLTIAVAAGFTAGWTLDSGINRVTPAQLLHNVAPEPPGPVPPPAPPKNTRKRK